MDQRTAGIIATAATTLLCGCPGLAGIGLGTIGFFSGVQGSAVSSNALFEFFGFLCLGVFLIVIPILVGFLTLRNKKIKITNLDEPLPPPS